ncbi:MAG: gamma-glutamyl-gamma-aminobutyrate hydrolase family protein [Oscillospiraceae bacterium]|jgi:putative glutamine amidotransferase|nr:gamma-glutamyl-gamma-aminobutyrate hydrolase family protein [Oscillospiraceae bacterium]
MRFLLTGGTLNPLKDEYLSALARHGHTGEIVYPDDPYPHAGGYDALLLPGGGDIDPVRFGASFLENGSETTDIPRDRLEFAVFTDFFSLKKPILGICRGMQVINVALGGTIWQDLPSQCGLVHAAPEGAPPMAHTVVFAGGREYTVNSYHHQAIRLPGRGLAVTAHSGDGTAEALEHETLPIRAVQWHPEKGGFGMEYLLKRL